MRRLLAVLVLAATATLSQAPPAAAGGPTSVLVTDPATGRATGLHYVDDRYVELDRLVSQGVTLTEEPAALGGQVLNLTWMIHDVLPWRTQQLYPQAAGGPVLATRGSEVTGDAGRTVWSRPADGNALTALTAGLLRGQATGRSGAGEAVPAEPAPAAPAEASPAAPAEAAASPSSRPADAPRVVTETAWWSLTGWRWALPGLLLGLAAGAGLATARRGRDAEAGPRQVLVDVPADRVYR